jgi:hypothetical protein
MKHVGPVCAVFLCLVAAQALADHGDMILNEWNAVAAGGFLAGDDYRDDTTKVDPYWATFHGMPDGRIEGNGGNWIELVVIADRLNIQGWQLRWAETDANSTDGSDPWYGNASVEQGIITFSPTAAIWSDLRKGTILTISEKHDLYVDTDWDGGGDDRNFTNGIDVGDTDVWDVNIPLRTDTSYNPLPRAPESPAADWWIHVSSRWEQPHGADALLTTVTNVHGDGPGDFSVGPDDWQLSIYDAAGTLIYGPIGEDITDFGNFPGGIDEEEAGRLEADPNATVDNDDYDDVTSTTFGAPNEWGGTLQQFHDLRVPEPASLLLLAAGVPLAIRRRRP